MSALCRICSAPIDDGTACAGFELPDDTFVCDTTDCSEFAIAVVQVAREVVMQADIAILVDVDDENVWDAIEKLREALAGLPRHKQKRGRQAADKQACIWRYDGTSDYWETSCGGAFGLLDGTPAENSMQFCPYCGQHLTCTA